MEFTHEQKIAFQDSLIALWVLHKDGCMPAELQKLYYQCLKDLGFEAVRNALVQSARTTKFFPKPVEIRELANGTSDQEAENAWRIATGAIELFGAYKSVEFDDSRISNAIGNCGGWQSFCERPETWLKKDFIAAFILLNRDCRPRKLLGIHDSNNQEYTPELIGFTGPPRIHGGATEMESLSESLTSQMKIEQQLSSNS